MRSNAADQFAGVAIAVAMATMALAAFPFWRFARKLLKPVGVAIVCVLLVGCIAMGIRTHPWMFLIAYLAIGGIAFARWRHVDREPLRREQEQLRRKALAAQRKSAPSPLPPAHHQTQHAQQRSQP